MFNLLTNVCGGLLRNHLVGCCVSATALFSSTGAVMASPHNPTVIIHASIGGQAECRPSGGFVQAEYERGGCSGRDKGFNAGYRDGINGHCYDNCVTASFQRSSGPFEDGYRRAFATAYVSGFERGNCDRRRNSEIRVEVRRVPIHCEPVCVLRTPCVETRRVEVIHCAPVHRGWRR